MANLHNSYIKYDLGFSIDKLGDKYGIINKDGSIILHHVFDEIKYFFDNGRSTPYVALKLQGRWGIIRAQDLMRLKNI